jgi:RND superfamily putative drug exporter
VLAFIALLTFLLLARELRSVVLAAKAVVVNLVSLGASFGFLVVFWQHGIGSQALYGVAATGAIRNWCSCWPGCARNTTAPAPPTGL